MSSLTKAQQRALVHIEHLDDDPHRDSVQEAVTTIRPQTLQALLKKGLVEMVHRECPRPTLTAAGKAVRDAMRWTGSFYSLHRTPTRRIGDE